MSEENLKCDICGGPATPGGLPQDDEVDTVCPECEDRSRVQGGNIIPVVDNGRVPPHGNTTR